MSDRLTALDATFLELEERDDCAHMHIGAIMVFEPPADGEAPSVAAVREQLEDRLDALPHYRSSLSEGHTGGLRWPAWEQDPGFDVCTHVRRAALPAPGGERELLDWAADYWSTRLDRSRPLWEVVLLEGLEGGRWALASKTHHALVDGVGSVDVGHLILDLDRDPEPRSAQPSPVAAAGGHGLAHQLFAGVRKGIDTMVHPAKLVHALEHSEAMLELLVRDEVVAAPPSSINVPIGSRRRYSALSIGLDEVKAIKNELGGTVNDVVLAAVTGGLRRLLLGRGDDLPSAGLRAMVPVNVRTAGEQLALGNKITSLFVHLPVIEPEPMRRYQLTVGGAEDLKAGTQGQGAATLVSLTGMAPPAVHSLLARALFASRLFNVTVTNVPGPQQQLYAFGARMERVLPLVPLAADHAVGVAVVSYAGRLFFGLNADERAVPDLDVLRDGIEDSLAELGEIARGSRDPSALAL